MQEAEVGGFMAQKKFWNTARKENVGRQRRGALPNEEGDLIREYEAMHEENFPGGWLREDIDGEAEEVEEMRTRTKE